MRRSRWVPTVLLAAGVVSGALGAQDFRGEYRVGPRDLLEIKVLEIPELNVDRRVNDGGTIALPMVGDFAVSGLTADEVRRLYVEATPLGRLETPEDVAAVAVFLASADSDFMTGVAVDVNGGAWMG